MNSYLEKLFFLQGRVAIVVDIDEKIGAIISESLALSGAISYGLGRHFSDRWQLVENEYYINCNPSNTVELQSLCQELCQKHGRLNVLVNTGNITISAEDIESLHNRSKDFYSKLEKKFQHIVTTSTTIAQFMKKSGGGSIINIVGICGNNNLLNSYSYANIKTDLTLMTKKLAIELIQDNIRVNNLVLGYTQDKSDRNKYLNREINHRLEELIGTTIFLASRSSRNVTGQSIFHFLPQ